MNANSYPPLLIVVTGRPGAGKSTLAHLLARSIRCPAICRDEIKEGLLNTAGESNGVDDVARRTYEIFFDTINLLISRRVTLIAEAAFQHKLWAPQLEPLRAVARIKIVVCNIDLALAGRRRIDRDLADPGRQRFHEDDFVRAAREGREFPVGEYVPPQLDVPTLMVNTAEGYSPDLDAISAFARR